MKRIVIRSLIALLICAIVLPASTWGQFQGLARTTMSAGVMRGMFGRGLGGFGRSGIGRGSTRASGFGRGRFGRGRFGQTSGVGRGVSRPGKPGVSSAGNGPRTPQATLRSVNARQRGAKVTTTTRPMKAPPQSSASSRLKASSNSARVSSRSQSGDGRRPTWRQSEKNVESALRNRQRSTYSQKAFKDKGSTSPRTAGSTRPDVFQTSRSGRNYAFEVKNYKAATAAQRNRLSARIAQQVKTRNHHLPAGTRQQIIVDVRGQGLSRAQMTSMKNSVVRKSNGILKPGQVSILNRTPKW